MENRVLSDIAKLNLECVIFDCDLILDIASLLIRAWDDVCELYSFQYLDLSTELSLLKKNPKTIAQIFLKRGDFTPVLFIHSLL
jgi:beta-phosphoglucomutase-like phosphatase (HAD superfamily)